MIVIAMTTESTNSSIKEKLLKMENEDIRIITLPAMRVGSFYAFSSSPKTDAWNKVVSWAKSHGNWQIPPPHAYSDSTTQTHLQVARTMAMSSGSPSVLMITQTMKSKSRNSLGACMQYHAVMFPPIHGILFPLLGESLSNGWNPVITIMGITNGWKSISHVLIQI
jgi:hypothetical protein